MRRYGTHWISRRSSSGWGAILGDIREARRRGGAIHVADVQAPVRHAYEILGVRGVMRAYPTESEAVAAAR